MSLSIGVEIEDVALRRATSSAPFPLNSDHQLRLIVDELERKNLPARVYVPSSTRGTGPNYSVWNVTIDATVSEVTSGSDTGPSAFRERFGFEVISPILYNTNANDIEWQQQLQWGVESIGNAVIWKANSSTGFHLHVGPSSDGGKFSLDSVKKVAMFFCCFEEAIDIMHPMHRRSGDYIMSNRHNDLLHDLTMEQIYDKINSANNVHEVCQIVNYTQGTNYDGYSDSRFSKINFTSLMKHDTIEFRQHEGTTNAQNMIIWIRFILKAVNFARVAPYAVIMAVGETIEDMYELIGRGRSN